jgi:hypothetical protein
MEVYGISFGIFISILRVRFCCFSTSKSRDVPIILDLDIYIKMDAFWMDLQNKIDKKCDRGPQEGGCIVWRGQISASGYGLQCVRWPQEGKRVENAHRVALMLKWRVTKSNFPDVDADGGLWCVTIRSA